MTTYNRYQKLQKYIDNVPQNEYKQGELIGEVQYETLEECEGRLQYRWVISETKTVCTGYDLYSLEVRQISKDSGVTWRDTNETRTGPLIEKWSKKCGVVTQYRWQATGVFGCNYGLATEQFIYQKSEDMGHTWEDVQPVQYKYETTTDFTDECLRQLDETVELEFDAGEEGGELTLNIDGGIQIGTWECDLEYTTRAWWVTYDRYFKVDWGDGDVTEQRHKGNLKSAAALPHYPSKPQVLNHIYRTGGLKRIKVHGPISGMSSTYPFKLVNFKQPYRTTDLVKQFSYIPGTYGGYYRTLRAPNFVNLAMSITNTNSLGEWEDERNLTNFSTLDISASPDFIGTTDEIRASYLDISNCPKLVNASNFTAVSTLLINGCESLTHHPKIVNVTRGNDEVKTQFPASLKYLDFEGTITWIPSSTSINTIDLTHLVNLERISGTFNSGTYSNQGVNRTGMPFNSTFAGLTSLKDVSGFTIEAGSETFRDCVNITEMPNVVLTARSANKMFTNTGITQVDLSKISGSGNFNNAFRGCPNLSSVIGSLHDLEAGSNFSGCFADNPLLTTVGPIFKNQTSKINIDYLFANCNITSIDNEFFKYDYTGDLITPIAAFAHNPNLNSYPIQNSLPIWKWPAFFTGEITYCGAFYGTKLDYPDGWTRMTVLKDINGELTYSVAKTISLANVAEVIDWGFATDTSSSTSSTLTTVPVGDFLYKDLTSFDGRNKLPSTITHLPEGFFKNTSLVSTASYLGWSLDEESWLRAISEFKSLTTLNYANGVATDVYNSYTSLGDIGSNPNLVNLDYAFKSMNISYLENFNPINIVSMDVTFWPNTFKGIENSFNGLTKLTSFDGNLPTVTDSIRNSFSGWAFRNIPADSVINSYNGVLNTSGNYVQDGIVNSYNDSKTTSITINSGVKIIKDSFNNTNASISVPSSVLVIADSFNHMSTFPTLSTGLEAVVGRCFENIPVTSVASKFANNTKLQVIPSDLFSTNKDITNFSNCFSGCINLTGSSPVDENGYKLWERAGKEGYPASITGTSCFAKCYKLDDFIDIPTAWGGNGGSNLIFKLHTDASYITINDFDYYNTTPKPIYIDNMTSYGFYSSTTSSSQTNTIDWFPDTKNVTTFTPFPSYYTINYIDLDARSTTSLAGLFYNVKSAGSIKVRNTQNVTDFSKSLCHINGLDMSTVDLNKGENFNYAFYYSTLNNAENLSLPKATDVTYAFYYSTITGDTLNLNIPLATSLYYTFAYSKVKNINLLDTGNITNLSYAFYSSTLENITGLDLSYVTNMDYAFYGTKLTSVDIYAPMLTTAKYTFRNNTTIKNFKFIAPALTSVDSYFLYSISAFDRVEVDLTSYTGTVGYLAKNAPYMLFRNIGLLNSYNLSFSSWGANSEENRQSIIDTLVTYSQDRSDNPCTVTLSTFTKSQISIEEMAQINAKGYTIA